MSRKYRTESEQHNRELLRKQISQLPPFCKDYFNSKHKKQIRTLLGYATDQKIFFTYMLKTLLYSRYQSIKEININDMDDLRPEDIDGYLTYISGYTREDGAYIENGESAKARKQSSLKDLIKFLHIRGYMTHNPCDTVEQVATTKKEIIILSESEKRSLFSTIREGRGLEGKRAAHQQRNILRDNAILMVLLGTGLRVSELVGLDIDDINMHENKISVIRKGGNEGHVYFSNQIKEAILDYLEDDERGRKSYNPPEDEKAVFISKRHSRMAVRTIEKMVKDYAYVALGPGHKKITPHKMRSTFGTELYNRKKDIRAVQAALGHASITTAEKAYVKFDETILKECAFDVLESK